MSIFQAIFLGFIQGLTEFLPVSSSGHLVIFQHFFDLTTTVLPKTLLLFDIVVHMGTLTAIVAFFFRKILKMKLKLALMIVLATLPAVIFGLLFKDMIEGLFSSVRLVGLALLLTGFLNFWNHRLLTKKNNELVFSNKNENDFSLKKNTSIKVLIVGFFQALAIVPGVSRSGSTVFAGVWQGWDRETAFEFSFLLAIPAILGATFLQLFDVIGDSEFLLNIDWLVLLVGFISALISGIISLLLFKLMIKKAKLSWFGWYCVVVGLGITMNSFLLVL